MNSKVAPAAYSKFMSLQPDAEFVWPLAPGTTYRETVDLRTTRGGNFENYSAQLLDPALEHAFTATCNPRLGLLIVYVFRRADFPWVGNWEESCSLEHAPWRKRTFCRGVEFSTTPFAFPRRESVTQGRLFGCATYRWLPAKSEAKIRFAILMFQIPADFRGVERVSLCSGHARVHERGAQARELELPLKAFL